MALIIVLCCIFRCRIPRTKQEIEADIARKKVTKQFSNHLQKIPIDRMELEKVLPEVITLEKSRIAEGKMEESMTFFQKLKKALFATSDDEEEEDDKKSAEGDSTTEEIDIEKGADDLIQTIESISTGDRLSSHQEQLAAALKKLNQIRLVQQQLQSGPRQSNALEDHKREWQTRKVKKQESRSKRRHRYGERSSSRETSHSPKLAKQKTCPQIPTDASDATDATASTVKRSASDDETVKNLREKRGTRLSRQMGYGDGDIALIATAKSKWSRKSPSPSKKQAEQKPKDDADDATDRPPSEARTKF